VIDLKGRSALVTGAAHGIGEAITRMFRQAGATVLAVDIESGEGEWFFRADVRSEADAGAAVERVVAATGRLDALVNNAAWLGPGNALLDATDEEWQSAWEVNLLGARNYTRAALRHMLPKRNGSIINIASVQAIAAARDSVAYTTTKTGLVGFTRSVAYDYGPHNIRANVICPGAIRTRISPPAGSELHARQIAKTFLGRIGSVDDVAYAALYLASDASAYVTGSVLAVDGGWSSM
jgi:2-keto-3-deoxy-L-fuconate dehydrogenase